MFLLIDLLSADCQNMGPLIKGAKGKLRNLGKRPFSAKNIITFCINEEVFTLWM